MALSREQHIHEVVYGILEYIAEARTAGTGPDLTHAEVDHALELVKQELDKEGGITDEKGTGQSRRSH